MADKQTRKIATSDRSMAPEVADRSQLFFFPKRNPPVSVRAETLEEAEELLTKENPNP